MTIRGSVIAASAMMATALLGGAAAQADQSLTPRSDGASKQQVQNESVVTSYWTEDRMKNAKPGSELMPTQQETAIGNSRAGIPTTIQGQDPESNPRANDNSRQKRTQYRAVSETPVSHIGKVFFTLGGTDYVCSGNSVASNNENTVSTAGHCLKDGAGAWATKFAFVPAYENGNAPYGVWAATSLYTTSQWSGSGDISYDTAFAVVSNPNGSASLSDTVGASGVAFNQARGLDYKAFGYPAGTPFNGASLYSCAGTATADPFGQTMSQGIPCDMTGGSSGGPWFIGSSSGGVQNSVNSFGYTSVPNTMFGPYWGSSIQSAYSNASNS
ncbi:trypsin-like serine peptidase [Arthrobacter monumenti]